MSVFCPQTLVTLLLWQLRISSTPWNKAIWRRNEKVQQHVHVLDKSNLTLLSNKENHNCPSVSRINKRNHKKYSKIYMNKCSFEWFSLWSMFTDYGALLFIDHSFFGSEWQKRWCVLNNVIFYYFGTEKGLCQTAEANRNITGS